MILDLCFQAKKKNQSFQTHKKVLRSFKYHFELMVLNISDVSIVPFFFSYEVKFFHLFASGSLFRLAPKSRYCGNRVCLSADVTGCFRPHQICFLLHVCNQPFL